MLEQSWYYNNNPEQNEKDNRCKKGVSLPSLDSISSNQGEGIIADLNTFANMLPDSLSAGNHGTIKTLLSVKDAFNTFINAIRTDGASRNTYIDRMAKMENALVAFENAVDGYYNCVGTVMNMINRLKAFEKDFRGHNPPTKEGTQNKDWYFELDEFVCDKLYQVYLKYHKQVQQDGKFAKKASEKYRDAAAQDSWVKECKQYWQYVGQSPVAIAWMPLAFTLYIESSDNNSSKYPQGEKERPSEDTTSKKGWNSFSFYSKLKPITATRSENCFAAISEVYEELKAFFSDYAPLARKMLADGRMAFSSNWIDKCPVFDWSYIYQALLKDKDAFDVANSLDENDLKNLICKSAKTSALNNGAETIPTLLTLCNYNRFLPLMWNYPVSGISGKNCEDLIKALLKQSLNEQSNDDTAEASSKAEENEPTYATLNKLDKSGQIQIRCRDIILDSSFCKLYKSSKLMDLAFAYRFSQSEKNSTDDIMKKYRKLFTHCATIIENVLFDSAMSNTGSGGQLQPDTAQMFNRTKHREDALTAVKSIADCIKESDMSAYKDVCISMLGSNQFSSKSEWETITGIKYVPGKKADKQTGHTATEYMAWLLVCEAYLSWLYSESSQAVEKALREILNG